VGRSQAPQPAGTRSLQLASFASNQGPKAAANLHDSAWHACIRKSSHSDLVLALCLVRRSTAVHLAARSCHRPMLETLLELLSPAERAELVNQPDNFGVTPLFLARQKWVGGFSAVVA
jgi:hypothetical protein